jgi:4-amino-4-deoxy-L-arabinose transferase-like glycosyltransferase
MIDQTYQHRQTKWYIQQASVIGLGLMIGVWAFLDQRFRDGESFLTNPFTLTISLSLALIIFGCALATYWRITAFWFALALIGQAAALQLINAGNLLHWQHYKPFNIMLSDDLPALLMVITQSIIVLASMRSRWNAIRTCLSQNLRWWQGIGIALVFVASAAAVQRDVRLYAGGVIFAVFIQAINVANLFLIMAAWPKPALNVLKARFETWLVQPPRRVDRFAMLASIWVFVVALVLSIFVYEWHPHITDEVGYVYQARHFADGTLALPAPPVPEAFDLFLMEIKNGIWYSPMSPAWPAMLAVGSWLGVPGLVNPFLAALNVLLIYLLIEELYDRRSARIAMVLLATSPWFVFMAMNFMPHTFTLTCALVAAVGVIRARHMGSILWGFVAGAGVGLSSVIRPLDGVIIAGLSGLWALGIGGKRLSLAALIAFALGVVLLGSTVIPFNMALSSSPTTFPVSIYLDSYFGLGQGRNKLGFGPRGYGWPVQPFAEHSPLAGMINANLNIHSLNTELFGWSIGSLGFVALLVFAGKLNKSDWMMLAVCAAVFVSFFFYYYSGGPDFGARYWYLMLVPLVALTIRGIDFLQSSLERSSTSVLIAVGVLSVLTLLNYFPWRAVDKYWHFWGMRPDVRVLAKQYNFGKSLVLVRAQTSHPDYASAAIYNPLYWNADAPVYAWDRDPEVRAKLLAAFPDRPVWIIESPSLTHSGYKVVAGPLSAQQLSRQDNTSRTNP